jgi:hypothetical protein
VVVIVVAFRVEEDGVFMCSVELFAFVGKVAVVDTEVVVGAVTDDSEEDRGAIEIKSVLFRLSTEDIEVDEDCCNFIVGCCSMF